MSFIFKRLINTATKDYFKVFPKTFPEQRPTFKVDLRKLRKEYRGLQAINHPDLNQKLNQEEGASSVINHAYNTLKSPLNRSQYLLKLLKGYDVAEDEFFRTRQMADKELLMTILEIHEELENANENDIEGLKQENDARIQETVQELEKLYEAEDYDAAALGTIKLKYWVNIDTALKNWELGKPVELTH
ncbi:unnamed protein product [Kuraishia capsulata CBS 1993]|uniref:J domain-containing protein n=1 Tax=Kuraishia capsulata CBS 1993 TaxID=1382522 RepID=W6MGP8_9ASCO|nr:uncharacterized protein KUCA_T00001313001 [Kuraishia capsulata CBS 1993]CDK25344.1 unnamed protein product [Kuraishia capsulata CBS 1993]